MVRAFSALALVAAVEGAMLRAGQEPDTACGKGFENLVAGSQAYYKTAAKELWQHPYHTADIDTYGTEFKCWFGNMATTKCGGLPSQADARKDKLTELCLAPTTDWLPVWNLFSPEEVKWFKDSYPAKETEEGSNIDYKQAMEVAKETNKKETLCLTLFTIDDECVKYPHIRLGKK